MEEVWRAIIFKMLNIRLLLILVVGFSFLLTEILAGSGELMSLTLDGTPTGLENVVIVQDAIYENGTWTNSQDISDVPVSDLCSEEPDDGGDDGGDGGDDDACEVLVAARVQAQVRDRAFVDRDDGGDDIGYYGATFRGA